MRILNRIKDIQEQSLGFTLVEMMVAVVIFTLVVTSGLGALALSSKTYKSSRSNSANINILSFVMESMSRRLRTGTSYTLGASSGRCDQHGGSMFSVSDRISFIDQDGDQVRYFLSGSSLRRTITHNDSSSTQGMIVPPGVSVDSLCFYLRGDGDEGSGTKRQPHVTIVLSAAANYKGSQTSFSLQTSITQRKLDVNNS